MKLEFDSVDELSEFLEFSKLLGKLINPQPSTINVTMRAEHQADAFAEAFTTTEQANGPSPVELTTAVLREMLDPVDAVSPETAADQGNESAPTEQPEQPKRKRRTKAEMEAARAAETQAENGFIMEASQATSGDAIAAGSGNPFEANAASPTTQAILNAPNQQAATLAGIAAMQTQSPFDTPAPTAESNSTSEPVAPAQAAASDAAGFIETRSLELLTSGADLTPIKHMHVCREFIAKHGQAKYLQGFTLAGLPATVGTYKAEQCARHQSALEFLNAN